MDAEVDESLILYMAPTFRHMVENRDMFGIFALVTKLKEHPDFEKWLNSEHYWKGMKDWAGKDSRFMKSVSHFALRQEKFTRSELRGSLSRIVLAYCKSNHRGRDRLRRYRSYAQCEKESYLLTPEDSKIWVVIKQRLSVKVPDLTQQILPPGPWRCHGCDKIQKGITYTHQ
jgi:hypothetical protein